VGGGKTSVAGQGLDYQGAQFLRGIRIRGWANRFMDLGTFETVENQSLKKEEQGEHKKPTHRGKEKGKKKRDMRVE